MACLDFDTLLICNNDFHADVVRDEFAFFKGYGIRKFIFAYNVDFCTKSASIGLRTIRELKSHIALYKPYGVSVRIFPNLLLCKDALYNPEISRLTCAKSHYVMMSLPLFNGDDWLEQDLNYFLYRKKLLPVFASLERNIATNSLYMMNRIIRLKSAILAIDTNCLTALKMDSEIHSLLTNNVMILPCISNALANYAGIYKSYLDLQSRIGINDYRKLCASIGNAQRML